MSKRWEGETPDFGPDGSPWQETAYEKGFEDAMNSPLVVGLYEALWADYVLDWHISNHECPDPCAEYDRLQDIAREKRHVAIAAYEAGQVEEGA